MERSRVTRYIRISVTALSLTACVLLVALWLRSYWWGSGVMIRFVPSPMLSSDTAARDNLVFGYSYAFISSSGGRLRFEAVTPGDGHSGTIAPPGIRWYTFLYDEQEDEYDLVERFGVDNPKELPFLLKSIGFHVGKYDAEFDDGFHLIMPHWLAALGFATLGALPWLPWSKRFSLRTLLIATTLVAVVTGIFVVSS